MAAGGKKFDPNSTMAGPPTQPSGMEDRIPGLSSWAGENAEKYRSKKMQHAGTIESELATARAAMLERWKHKNEGTPETHEKSGMDIGALGRMFVQGYLSADQLAWAEEIALAAEMIERDVAIKIVDYVPRIDCSSSGRDVLVEGIMNVRRQIAYREWRKKLTRPKEIALSMLIGERISYSAAARLFHIHKRKARNILITSIDSWPDAMEIAENEADAASIAAAHAGLI